MKSVGGCIETGTDLESLKNEWKERQASQYDYHLHKIPSHLSTKMICELRFAATRRAGLLPQNFIQNTELSANTNLSAMHETSTYW